MERNTIVTKLTEVFRKVFNNETIDLSDELTANDVENWDSLSHMLLITEIENEFQIRFKLKELNKMRNVGEMINLITGKVQLSSEI
jgi:acyl carrier protein